MKAEKLTLGIKCVVGCFASIALMGAGYSNLTNADKILKSDVQRVEEKTVSEVKRLDKRVDANVKEEKSIREIMAIAITDIEVIKFSQRNQEEQSKEQVVLLREILKHQITGNRR